MSVSDEDRKVYQEDSEAQQTIQAVADAEDAGIPEHPQGVRGVPIVVACPYVSIGNAIEPRIFGNSVLIPDEITNAHIRVDADLTGRYPGTLQLPDLEDPTIRSFLEMWMIATKGDNDTPIKNLLPVYYYPQIPSKRAGRKGTRKGWKRLNPPRILYADLNTLEYTDSPPGSLSQNLKYFTKPG